MDTTTADNLYFLHVNYEKLNRRELLEPRTGRPAGWTPPAALDAQRVHAMLLAYVWWIISINRNIVIHKFTNRRNAWITYNYVRCSTMKKFPLNYGEYKACSPEEIEATFADIRAVALVRTQWAIRVNMLSDMMVKQTHIVNELLSCFKVTDIK